MISILIQIDSISDKETICGSPRKIFSWSNERIDGPIESWQNKTCHDRTCMITYTQIPLWSLVIIALGIGFAWEVMDTFRRYRYHYGVKATPMILKAIFWKVFPCFKTQPQLWFIKTLVWTSVNSLTDLVIEKFTAVPPGNGNGVPELFHCLDSAIPFFPAASYYCATYINK